MQDMYMSKRAQADIIWQWVSFHIIYSIFVFTISSVLFSLGLFGMLWVIIYQLLIFDHFPTDHTGWNTASQLA